MKIEDHVNATTPSSQQNGAATDAVWRRFATELHRFFRRRVADDTIADDLLQECFLRIHQRLPQLADPSRAGAWVSTIARNLVRDHYRHAKPVASPLTDDIASVDEPVAFDPVEQHLGAWIRARLADLPEHEARAIELADLEGIRQTVAATQLGLSHSGFKSRVQRGRSKLRDALDDCCKIELGPTGRVLDYHRRETGSGDRASTCGTSECGDGPQDRARDHDHDHDHDHAGRSERGRRPNAGCCGE